MENASSNKEVLDAMGQASRAFKGANGNMDVDKIHDLMDDMAEQNQIASEISTAISNPVGFDQEVDEVTKNQNKFNILYSRFLKLFINLTNKG